MENALKNISARLSKNNEDLVIAKATIKKYEERKYPSYSEEEKADMTDVDIEMQDNHPTPDTRMAKSKQQIRQLESSPTGESPPTKK